MPRPKARRLSLAELEQRSPHAAIEFHSFLVKVLSARLTASSEQIAALI